MKTCCLVWEIPVIEGEHYNPIMNVIYMQKAKKFLNQLNRYFQNKNMDWKCVLDRSACTYNEIFSGENQAVIFAPEAKTRQWLYKKVPLSCASATVHNTLYTCQVLPSKRYRENLFQNREAILPCFRYKTQCYGYFSCLFTCTSGILLSDLWVKYTGIAR